MAEGRIPYKTGSGETYCPNCNKWWMWCRCPGEKELEAQREAEKEERKQYCDGCNWPLEQCQCDREG